jgi:hypothetical protein
MLLDVGTPNLNSDRSSGLGSRRCPGVGSGNVSHKNSNEDRGGGSARLIVACARFLVHLSRLRVCGMA